MLVTLVVLISVIAGTRGFSNDTLPRNTVVPSNSPTQLHYHSLLGDGETIQWTVLLTWVNCTDTQYVYYATSNWGQKQGGVLPDYEQYYYALATSNGIGIHYVDNYVEGKYKLTHLSGLNAVEWQAHVASSSLPSCVVASGDVEGDWVWASCSASSTTTMTQFFAPKFTWYKAGQPVNGTLTYSGPELDNTDMSDPKFEETCQAYNQYFKFPVRNTTIIPSSHNTTGGFVVTVGDVFNCTTFGSHPLYFSWEKVSGNGPSQPVTGQELQVTTDMMGVLYNTYKCTASNFHFPDKEDVDYVTFLAVSNSSIYITPKPITVAYPNEVVSLPCTFMHRNDTEKETSYDGWHYQWAARFYESEDNATDVIYTANHLASGILRRWQDEFDASETLHDITLLKATPNRAGTYTCVATKFPLTEVYSTALVVTNSLKCGGMNYRNSATNFQDLRVGDVIELFCDLEYASNEAYPIFTWFKGKKMLDGFDKPPKDQSPASMMRKRYTHRREVSAEDEGMTFRCSVTFRTAYLDNTPENGSCTIKLSKVSAKDTSDQRKLDPATR